MRSRRASVRRRRWRPRSAFFLRLTDGFRKREHYEKPSVKRKKKALLGRQRLLLTLDRRLLIVLALPDLAQDACLLALLLEALHGVLERLAFLDAHARHSRNHHPSRGTQLPRVWEAREYTREWRGVNGSRKFQ